MKKITNALLAELKEKNVIEVTELREYETGSKYVIEVLFPQEKRSSRYATNNKGNGLFYYNTKTQNYDQLENIDDLKFNSLIGFRNHIIKQLLQ